MRNMKLQINHWYRGRSGKPRKIVNIDGVDVWYVRYHDLFAANCCVATFKRWAVKDLEETSHTWKEFDEFMLNPELEERADSSRHVGDNVAMYSEKDVRVMAMMAFSAGVDSGKKETELYGD